MSSDVEVHLVADIEAEVGEGPAWDHATETLVFIDVTAGHIHRYDPKTDTTSTTEFGQPVGAAIPRTSGGLVVPARDGVAGTDESGRFEEWLANIEAHAPANRMNDAKCDPAGRLWAGTMSFDGTPGAGILYRIDADLRWQPMVYDVTVSNGLAWSPSNDRMYYIDSGSMRVDVFAFDHETGGISRRRPLIEFAEADGIPDGMTIDRDGYLWVAFFGTHVVRRIHPEGRVDGEIRLPPAQVTSCTFGGPDLEDLYITTARYQLSNDEKSAQRGAGGLYRSRPGVAGTPTIAFAG